MQCSQCCLDPTVEDSMPVRPTLMAVLAGGLSPWQPRQKGAPKRRDSTSDVFAMSHAQQATCQVTPPRRSCPTPSAAIVDAPQPVSVTLRRATGNIHKALFGSVTRRHKWRKPSTRDSIQPHALEVLAGHAADVAAGSFGHRTSSRPQRAKNMLTLKSENSGDLRASRSLGLHNYPVRISPAHTSATH